MFDSLDDQIKHDAAQESTRTERVLRWTAAVVVTFLVLGGIYYAVRLFE